MKGNEKGFLEFLSERSQFFVPIFQRRYSWEKTHCEQLWNDILRIGQNDDILSYFLGSIVYMKEGTAPIGTVPRYLVIDGQQRLATLSLLILALGGAIDEHGSDIGITQDQLSNIYLFNHMEDSKLRYKLLLTRSDEGTLIQLLNGKTDRNDLSGGVSLRLVENYQFFFKKLTFDNLKAVYAGIQKLMIVHIILEWPGDNPQLIFDSLNSTGLELSQADRIRNYVLMGRDIGFQNRLYEDYWFPLENRFGNNYAKLFDLFIRDYLTLKTRQIPKLERVYDEFMVSVPHTAPPEKLETEIASIDQYSRYYVKFALLKEDDPDILACFTDIEDLEVTVAHPFLLEVYENYEHGTIQKTEFIEILRLVESYVFRRVICEVPTNRLNRMFVSLMRGVGETDYFKNLKLEFQKLADISDLTDTKRFPSNNEFKKALFGKKDVYNFKRRNYLLRKLEEYGYREPFNDSAYSVEHIMPQNENLSETWQQELGENWKDIHETLLHNIGNLTFVEKGYNVTLSDRSFAEKKNHEAAGFRKSRLRLNDSVVDVERWNEDAIRARAKELAKKACNIWKYPE